MLDFLHRVQQQDNNFIWEKMTEKSRIVQTSSSQYDPVIHYVGIAPTAVR